MSATLDRRRLLLASGAWLAGCAPATDGGPAWSGGFVGEAVAAGHAWRDGAELPPPDSVTAVSRCDVLVVGAGVAGLSAARSLREAGIEEVVVLDLHDQPGGNSRGLRIGDQPCPLGAHYLPVPDAGNPELLRWLHEIGLARQQHGRTVFDERHLCHSPQERVWHDGAWHEGLLPPLEPGSAAYVQAGRLSARIDELSRTLGFAMPASRAAWGSGHAALDAQTFAHWLDAQGIIDPLLRWYLDYACRDDYGAPADTVSAWAGIHYFASRHGFRPPGVETEAGADAVLTWPDGNAFLIRHLAAPLGDRVKTGWLVVQIEVLRDRVVVRARDLSSAADGSGAWRRWEAQQLVLATPLNLTVRAWPSAPEPLRQVAARLPQAPWLVANLQLDRALADRPGVAPAWDNVVAGRAGLGYIDAGHQHVGVRGPEAVLTAYHALPVDRRGDLLAKPWANWSRWVVDDLAATHADLPSRVRRVDITRHGHAMAVPVPGLRGDSVVAALRGGPLPGRVQLAHADLAGYSVFEEAFELGWQAGRRVAAGLRSG